MDDERSTSSSHEPTEAELFFELAPDALVVVAENGTITRANRAAEVMFGCLRAELVGCPVEELVPEHLRAGHVARRQGFTGLAARPMGTRPERLYARRRDGSTFPVDVALGPMRVGGAREVLAAVRDLTSQVRAEEALRAHEAAAADQAARVLSLVRELDAHFAEVLAHVEQAGAALGADHAAADRLADIGGVVSRASLVIAEVLQRPSPSRSEPSPPDASRKPRAVLGRVLCVDDEPMVLSTTMRVLRALGYTTTGFGSSRAAVEAFRTEPNAFDAIVADFHMPGLTGLDVAREARAIRADIPVILVSGSLTDADPSPPTDVRAALPKPFAATQLAAALAEAIGHTRRRG